VVAQSVQLKHDFAVDLKEYCYLCILNKDQMQLNQQSFNIFVVSRPVAACTPVPGQMDQFFRHENFIILKVVKEIEATN